jgi:uncharacterized cupin superfamily protein
VNLGREEEEAMGNAKAEYVVDRVDAESYEPDMVDGTQVGEFHQIEPARASSAKLDVCIWRSDPARYEYLFESDEAFHVVEGAATVELPDTDESVVLRAGDVGYFMAGTRSIWTITQRFTKFTVIAN